MLPHSSDSTWPKPIHRNLSKGITRATAADTSGNIPRPAAVIEHWLVGQDQELVEGESGRRGDFGGECGEPEDPWGDFISLCFHG